MITTYLIQYLTTCNSDIIFILINCLWCKPERLICIKIIKKGTAQHSNPLPPTYSPCIILFYNVIYNVGDYSWDGGWGWMNVTSSVDFLFLPVQKWQCKHLFIYLFIFIEGYKQRLSYFRTCRYICSLSGFVHLGGLQRTRTRKRRCCGWDSNEVLAGY